MRSCLIQILVTVAVVFCLVWFVLPIGVSALATGAVRVSVSSSRLIRFTVTSPALPAAIAWIRASERFRRGG